MPNIDTDVVRFFHSHLVPMLFTFRYRNELSKFMVTAFAFSVSDRWFLITAGHCIAEVNALIDSSDYEYLGCQLFDGGGVDAKHFDPIPFPFNKSVAEYLSDNRAYDYGIVKLSLLYVKLLRENNVIPLNEQTWKNPPEIALAYWLLGIPTELVKYDGAVVEYMPSFHPVEQVHEMPDGFDKVDVPQFYGRIAMDSKMESIKGMSGGPVFAFQRNEKGELRYWLEAIQSRWLPHSHHIAACPAQLLGDFLEHLIASEKES